MARKKKLKEVSKEVKGFILFRNDVFINGELFARENEIKEVSKSKGSVERWVKRGHSEVDGLGHILSSNDLSKEEKDDALPLVDEEALTKISNSDGNLEPDESHDSDDQDQGLDESQDDVDDHF